MGVGCRAHLRLFIMRCLPSSSPFGALKKSEVHALTHTHRPILPSNSSQNPQAGAGLVADSVPEMEWEETVNKAAALGRAIDLAEQAFVTQDAEAEDPSEDCAQRALHSVDEL